MKYDIKDIYTDRIEEINRQMQQCKYKKDWVRYYKLKAEKEKLKQVIK